LLSSLPVHAQSWTAKLDKDITFYQPTEMGVLIVGTEKSLYAIDASTGDTLWRRKDTSLDETDVAPVSGTDLLLLSLEKGDKARIEAVDILTGESIWRSEKLKGAVMQTSVDPDSILIAVVLAKDVKNRARDGFKRRPLLHVLDLATGEELWKYDIGEVEMMPSRWPEDSGKEVDYTLDNYTRPPSSTGGCMFFMKASRPSTHAPVKSDCGRSIGSTKTGSRSPKPSRSSPKARSMFSGHGRVRAISRQSGDTEWEAKDLGLTPEMVLVGDVLYVRTGDNSRA
jgi:outer membrane protein assembly factor BamB